MPEGIAASLRQILLQCSGHLGDNARENTKMNWIPPVRARLAGRLIFNFRLPPAALASMLPEPWLVPQAVNGFAIASFCILDLRGITVAPLSTAIGISSISCAPRLAVIDRSTDPPRPAVFVPERWTSSAFGSWFTSLGFSCRHPYAAARWSENDSTIQVSIDSPNKGQIVSACVTPTAPLESAMFESTTAFAAFIAQGVSSYGRSRFPGRLTKVDLHKSDNTYTPLRVEALDGPAIREWQGAGGVLDSAFQTSGGIYTWIYHGLTASAREPHFSVQPLPQ
jgi:hypothetical protein